MPRRAGSRNRAHATGNGQLKKWRWRRTPVRGQRPCVLLALPPRYVHAHRGEPSGTSGVDDPPRQIAAERGNQHCADRHLIRSRDTDGARDRSTPLSSRTEFRRAAQQVRVHAQTAAWNPPTNLHTTQGPARFAGFNRRNTENRSLDEPSGEMC